MNLKLSVCVCGIWQDIDLIVNEDTIVYKRATVVAYHDTRFVLDVNPRLPPHQFSANLMFILHPPQLPTTYYELFLINALSQTVSSESFVRSNMKDCSR